MRPADLEAGLELFEEFHDQLPRRIVRRSVVVPRTVDYIGRAGRLIYVSDKWDAPGHRWGHDFGSDVGVYQPGRSIQVPDWITSARTLVKLGRVSSGDLYATPHGRALLTLRGDRVIGLMWGGGLQVQSRGIVG